MLHFLLYLYNLETDNLNIVNMKLKHNSLFFLLILLSIPLFAAQYPHEPVRIPGIENPVDLAISPDGLQMLIVDWPKKEKKH